MKDKIYIVTLVLSVIIRSAFGQIAPASKEFVYSNTFTTENGLSQNNVSCLTKDRNGFIWVGTGNGLNRFDGYSFIHFSHSDSDSSSLTNDAVRNLLMDSKGRIWVGTYDGLSLYDPIRETFRNFKTDPSNENTISQNTILCLMEDRKNNLWVGTYWGLNKINLESLEITRYFAKTDGSGLADNAVNALLEDRNGKIWVCTSNGINILGPNGIESTITQTSAPDGLTSQLIVGVVQDSKGVIYLGTHGSGILRLENENDRTFEYFTHTPKTPSLGSNVISSIALDQNGSLVIGTDGAGLYKHLGNGTFIKIVDRKNKALDHGSIQRIYIDDQNNYWTGLFGAGLLFIPGDRPRLEHYQFFDSRMEQLTKNSVLAIAEDHHKKIWIGTDGAGLYKFDPETKQFSSYEHSASNVNTLSTNVIKSLLVDEHNNLYIGTYAGGLNYLDTRTMTFSRYLHNSLDKTSISTNHVWSLLQSKNKRIYVGQLGGLDEFLAEKKTFRQLTIPGNTPVTINTASVFSMIEGSSGHIWMGTRLAGIHRYDPFTDSFRSFIRDPGENPGFPTNEILDLELDSDGHLLVGTDNKGLIRFNTKEFTFTTLVPAYKEQNVPSVLEDNFRNLWFTSFDGLHRYNQQNDEIYDYSIADGLQGIQFNEGARLKSSTGDFYFGGTNGLNVFRPDKMQEDHTKPKVVFTGLSLFHDPVRINDKSKLLTENIANTKVITFQPEQNVFSIEFACLEYKFPKTNRYRYYLEGFDNGWNDIKENRTATYTNLPPGEYTLKVSATNNNGHWNEEAASIKLVVLPRWHQLLGVRIGFLVLLIAFTVGIIYTRTSFLLNQKRKLEALVAARTATVEAQKEEIKEKNEKLENAYEEVNAVNEELQELNTNLEKVVEKRTEELRLTIKKLIETDEGLNTFLYRSSHDLRSPITSLLGLARLAKIENRQSELTPYFSNIEVISLSMMRLLARLSDTAALFRGTRKAEVIIVDTFMKSIAHQLATLNCGNTVRIDIENNIGESFRGDPMLLKHIIMNLMENSIIFRRQNNPFVQCRLFREKQFVVIQVTDNGPGISPEGQNRIFDMFYRGSEKSIGNGLGLFMVKKALEILEGSITLESEPNVKTTFTVRIPG